MNKSELIAKVAEKAGITKKDAEKAVAGIFASVQEALVAGDKVQVIGFGTFEVMETLKVMNQCVLSLVVKVLTLLRWQKLL